ncbi:MAG: benzoyl-CoA reductase subunit A [Acidobacteria bacterium]|nr:benzoyl-CoA reductase subunit A [Acidobacteriota bacterium]
MDLYLGIDLGSTTSKAVAVGEDGRILGRGITNTRSNYRVASDIAREEALHNARFAHLARAMESRGYPASRHEAIYSDLALHFRLEGYLKRLDALARECERTNAALSPEEAVPGECLAEVFEILRREAPATFDRQARNDSSKFFRDIAGTAFADAAEEVSTRWKLSSEPLVAIYERSIVPAENDRIEMDFGRSLTSACARTLENHPEERENSGFVKALEDATKQAVALDLVTKDMVGTGYGRQLLPFPEESIRSEILCHGLGAHRIFPETRTVLDIGGQDTKAIQVNGEGVVTSFHMNDRCAAGCGRYLGYIADELAISVKDLGPLACKADKTIRISSTCTVFAGAELRDLLNLGEKRENILAGLHRAIVLRAFSLLARSGGVHNEFTFTGGVAKNVAVVQYTQEMVRRNYGAITMNVHPDSIYMGALGAALFALRAARGESLPAAGVAEPDRSTRGARRMEIKA